MKKVHSNSIEMVDRKLNGMADFETARWYALIDAVNIVADMATEKNIDFDNVDIKPSAIEHYIESTCDIYCRKIYAEKEKQKEKTAGDVAANIIKQIKESQLTHATAINSDNS